MRLHRFFIREIVGIKKEITIHSVALVNQIQRVFRLKSGDSVVIFDGTGSDFECRISKISKNSIILDVVVSMRSPFNPSKKVYLFASLVKKDIFEWIAEKATELGVTHIIPVISLRSEKKSLNMERLEKIVIEASEQSGRGFIPEIKNIVKLEDAVQNLLPSLDEGVRPIAFHTEGEMLIRKEIEKNENVAIFIGPEGGWTQDELDLFHRNGVDVRCIGNQILRAETAVVAVLSQVVFDL